MFPVMPQTAALFANHDGHWKKDDSKTTTRTRKTFRFVYVSGLAIKTNLLMAIIILFFFFSFFFLDEQQLLMAADTSYT